MNYIYNEIKEKYSDLKIAESLAKANTIFLNKNIKYYKLQGRPGYEFNSFTNTFNNSVIDIRTNKIIKVEVYEDYEDAIATKLHLDNGETLDYNEYYDFEIIDNTIIDADDNYNKIPPEPEIPQNENGVKIIELNDIGNKMLNEAYINLLKARGEL